MSPRRSGANTWLRAVPSPARPQATPQAASPALDDETLIDAVARGDSKIATALYDRLIGIVDRALYRVFGRRESDHDDLVQAAFEQIVLTLTRRRFAGACSLSSWACHVATHVGLNALRARRRERRVLGLIEDTNAMLTVPARGPNVEDEAGARRDIDRIRTQLAEMSPEKAETVLLHDVFGYELAEIAVLTGASVSAVQSRLVRGRKELHLKLGLDKADKGKTERDRTSEAPPRSATRLQGENDG
jgi:RNA polymerase sigma-70 factor (ECF subfamily)